MNWKPPTEADLREIEKIVRGHVPMAKRQSVPETPEPRGVEVVLFDRGGRAFDLGKTTRDRKD